MSSRTGTAIDAARAVLTEVSEARRGQIALAAQILQAAAAWADLHPGLDPEWIAFASGGDGEVTLAGDGTPSVDGRCVAELGAALGQSTEAARGLIGDALELRHRLPRLWARVVALQLPAWEARRAAQCTRHLSREAVAFVDAQLTLLPRLSYGRVERLVEAAVARFMPDRAEAERREAAELRRVDIGACQLSGPADGLATVTGIVDLADALELDATLNQRAADLADLAVPGSQQVRRSIALGELARGSQPVLDLEASAETRTVRRRPAGHQVVLYVHLSQAALAGDNEVAWLDRRSGRADLVDRAVLSGQVRDWCATPGATITVRPVIDPHRSVTASGYHVPESMLEQLRLRDGNCIFPHCGNARVDADHRVPYDHDHPECGGQTHTDNLALLCRHHHRLKTFTRWRYRQIRPGLYLWTSPHGRRCLRDELGTYPLEPPDLE